MRRSDTLRNSFYFSRRASYNRGGLKWQAAEATCTGASVKRCGLRVIVTRDCGIATRLGASCTSRLGFGRRHGTEPHRAGFRCTVAESETTVIQTTQGNALESLCCIQRIIDEPAEDARPSPVAGSLEALCGGSKLQSAFGMTTESEAGAAVPIH
jgi:hypothetical protein